MNYGYAKLAEIYNVNEFCTCNSINNKHIIILIIICACNDNQTICDVVLSFNVRILTENGVIWASGVNLGQKKVIKVCPRRLGVL